MDIGMYGLGRSIVWVVPNMHEDTSSVGGQENKGWHGEDLISGSLRNLIGLDTGIMASLIVV